MPYIKVYIHFVWSTKNRYPFLNTLESRQLVWKHIKENANAKGIFNDYVNEYEDHCHCLISMGFNQNIEKIMQLIKGESSFWINKNQHLFPNLKGKRFEWQEEFLHYLFLNLFCLEFGIIVRIRKHIIRGNLLSKSIMRLSRSIRLIFEIFSFVFFCFYPSS